MRLARRRATAWIAIFAVLLAALAPTVARALSPARQAVPWDEICTVAGAQTRYDLAPASSIALSA